jgi:succinate dehydrogenase hydrophobic anchor subunit
MVKYYRGGESCLNRLYMAFSGIAVMLYVIDILYYTIIDDVWGIGMVNG